MRKERKSMRSWLTLLAAAIIFPAASIAQVSPSDLAVLRQLPDLPETRKRIAVGLEELAGISSSQLSPEQTKSFDAIASLVIVTSSVEKSPSGRYTVLYSTPMDLFTILGPTEAQKSGLIFLAQGSAFAYAVGKGRLPIVDDFAETFFRLRPKLQRDAAALLDSDEKSMLVDLQALKRNKDAVQITVAAMMAFYKSEKAYFLSPCLSEIEAFRASETFALRFAGGKKTSEHMVPRGLARISDIDNAVLEDDQLGRQFAFIETSAAPACQIKRVRIFFSY